VSHPNAALTPKHRLIVARLVVKDGWAISEIAARFQVSWPTVKRWVDRYLADEPMHDRSSRPSTSPNKTDKATTKRCVSLRIRLRECPAQLGIAPSTVHRILASARLNRLSHVGRATGEPIRRYEHPPRLNDPRGREEGREHPRRRRMALRRPPARQPQPDRHTRQTEEQVARTEDGPRVRPHRHRRPLPRRLCRGPRR